MKNNSHPFYPQLLVVDGNGLLNPRALWQMGRCRPAQCDDLCQLSEAAPLLFKREDEREALVCDNRRTRIFPPLIASSFSAKVGQNRFIRMVESSLTFEYKIHQSLHQFLWRISDKADVLYFE
ncbi:hypothetical protein LguiB_026906 [Lonicera macranthoides]